LQPIVVVAGATAPEVAAEVHDLPVHVATNPSWEKGMGSSVRAGVKSLSDLEPDLDALIIMLCDQPEISAATLDKLIDAHDQTGKSLCAASFGDTVAPPALFGRQFFDELLAIPEPFGAKQILLSHSADLLRVDCPEAAGDVDTPADYDALKSSAR
jgi:molybdenum cofactor cytidylyltransferase